MDNKYTRKEEVCPITTEYCECVIKNCSLCLLCDDDYEGIVNIEQMSKIEKMKLIWNLEDENRIL